MPRRKRPKNPPHVRPGEDGEGLYTWDDPEHFSLSEIDSSHLAQLAGMEPTSQQFRRMASSIEDCIDWYREKSIEPLPSQMAESFQRIKRKMEELVEELNAIDHFTYEALVWWGYYDFADEFEQSLDGLTLRLERYESEASVGRPKNIALRRLARALRITAHEAGVDPSKQRNFVIGVLEAAGIPHPDPDEQRSRFDEIFNHPEEPE